MDKSSTPERRFYAHLDALCRSGKIPEKYRQIASGFFECYRKALADASISLETALPTLLLFLDLMAEQSIHPYTFAPYHQKVRSPIDYYRFSLEFIRPLVDFSRSTVTGIEIASEIEERLAAQENAIFFANHQTETDPQAIALLLEQTHPRLAETLIFVAGERVITDPVAIPFSMGCDLLCIYSKRYIDNPPELKAEKQLHNQSTMQRMSRLLEEGGKAIYVAPSGGRDRKNAQGVVEVAPFDPQSVEMFYLMAKRAKTPTHFYPLTLATYSLLPPPDTIQIALGETRIAHYCPIHLAFSPAFDMERYPGSDAAEKTARRKNRADALWRIVVEQYQRLTQG
jgi:glycerol-3-phosphate O-acyltransferase